MGIIDSNPLEKLKLLKTDRSPKVRFLSDEEERTLRTVASLEREERIKTERDQANSWRTDRGYELFEDLRLFEFADYLRPMILLSINTDLRRGELFSLIFVGMIYDIILHLN